MVKKEDLILIVLYSLKASTVPKMTKNTTKRIKRIFSEHLMKKLIDK